MRRAAVLIAVQKAGKLPKLSAAIDGVRKMEAWALAHQIQPDSIKVFTDEQGPVHAAAIFDAVRAFVDTASYDQLFVYFSGHGVNLFFNEYWLLTNAPDAPHEAINVSASAQLAKFAGIPHVVFISDACRTPAEGIQFQRLTGTQIFPNLAGQAVSRPVDVFYATTLGAPALELRDGDSVRYTSVYTEELVQALSGQRRTILSPDQPHSGKLVLRSHPLRRHLQEKVPALVAARLGPGASHSQTPDADILSDEFTFLQWFDAAQVPPEPAAPMPALRGGRPLPAPRQASAAEVARATLRTALHAAPSETAQQIGTALRGATADVSELDAAVRRETEAHGPAHFETNCGFKLLGGELSDVIAPAGVHVALLEPALVRVDLAGLRAADVLFRLTDGRCVVLPAIEGFLGSLTFVGRDLRTVAYEPSDRSDRWQTYQLYRSEITALRGLIAASVYQGVFRLDPEDAERLIDRIRHYKSLDPALALYAGYAYHRLGRIDLIREMQMILGGELGVTLFDLALLASGASAPPRHPFAPLLAQGWPLLEAFGDPGDALRALRSHVDLRSLWTVYDADAFSRLETLIRR